jgi:hypothetical protein
MGREGSLLSHVSLIGKGRDTNDFRDDSGLADFGKRVMEETTCYDDDDGLAISL